MINRPLASTTSNYKPPQKLQSYLTHEIKVRAILSRIYPILRYISHSLVCFWMLEQSSIRFSKKTRKYFMLETSFHCPSGQLQANVWDKVLYSIPEHKTKQTKINKKKHK